jgi:mRNA interferase MazF
MERKRAVVPKRGDIFVVDFEHTVGHEIKKTRPALVLQNNVANRYSLVITIAAITSHDANTKLYPTEVFISHTEGGLHHDSVILLNQIRTIDKRRLVKKLGKVNTRTMIGVNRALDISLGMIKF